MTGRSNTAASGYSVLIVGGGINGAGTFRDLCLQGVDCLLVDAGDFCAGTSAAPSRLIHGGIKYLEVGEFKLVRQSTKERNLLLRNAPHYVRPIRTVLPMRSISGGLVASGLRFIGRNAKLVDRGALIVKLGLAMFDFYGRRHRVLPRHRMMFGAGVREAFPDMSPDIVAIATYHDAKVTMAERLGLELVLDGLRANPESSALNHVELQSSQAGRFTLRDRVDGTVRDVSATIVINAGGAQIDTINARLGLDTSHIGGQKGSHLIVANERLRKAIGDNLIYFGTADGRIGLAYPFMGHVLVGSTDIPVANSDEPVCEQSERRYMLDVLAEIFPDIGVTDEEVVYTYAGVRPLPRSEGRDPGAVSRDHSIVQNRTACGVPVLSLIGGKWTTFRGFAEEAADLVLDRLGRERRASTRFVPIGGGRDFPTVSERAGFMATLCRAGASSSRAETLFERYGTRALDVANWCAERQDEPLRTAPDYSRAEIGFIATHESVRRLADVVFRRTDIALSCRLTRDVVVEMAEAMSAELGWGRSRLDEEVDIVVDQAVRLHGMKEETLIAA